MNAEIKQKWIEALRSGRYQQGKERLRDPSDRFCCLGVLLDVIDPTRWEKNHSGKYLWNGTGSSVPFDLAVQIGLEPGEQNGFDNRSVLMKKNDGDGFSFDQIADYIEANL